MDVGYCSGKNPKSGGAGLELREHKVKQGSKVGLYWTWIIWDLGGLIYTRGLSYLKHYLILNSI